MFSDNNTSSYSSYPKLTLKSVQRIGNTGTDALPATTFSYGLDRGPLSNPNPNGGWNRISSVDNGQGGVITFTFENIGKWLENPLSWVNGAGFRNNHRLTSKVITTGAGQSWSNTATWSYNYQKPVNNGLGTILYGNEQNNGLVYPNSAAIYFNYYYDSNQDNTGWLVHKLGGEFRGHSQVNVTAPDLSVTEHYFYQGDIGCVPTTTGGNILWTDSCFANLRDREFLKGKEWKTRVLSSTGSVMNETIHYLTVEPTTIVYGPNISQLLPYAFAGVWRGWDYEDHTVQNTYEGNATPMVKTTYFTYNSAYQDGGGGVQYGNLTKVEEYDTNGTLFRTSVNRYNTKVDATNYIVDRVNQQYTYDGRGNLTQITGGTKYKWDGADRLISATVGANTALYTYDDAGHRVKQTQGITTTNYLWDEMSPYGDVVYESDGTNSTNYTLGNGELLSQKRSSSTTEYFLMDGHSGVRNLDSNTGSILQSYNYDAFGNLQNFSGTPNTKYLYTGQQFDSLTGLYDLRARYYNPSQGRFLSRDIAGVDFNNPIELHRYGYTANNPINRTDSSGYGFLETAWSCICFVVNKVVTIFGKQLAIELVIILIHTLAVAGIGTILGADNLLRDRMLRASPPNIPAPFQAHHIIPQSFRFVQIINQAAAAGWDIDGPDNGILLPEDMARNGLPQHGGSHANYNAIVNNRLSNLFTQAGLTGMTNQQVRIAVEAIVRDLRNNVIPTWPTPRLN